MSTTTDIRPTPTPVGVSTTVAGPSADKEPWLARLTHVIRRYRWVVIGAWILLTVFGGFAPGSCLALVPGTSIPR
jgi:hypothetical protein